VGRRRSVSRAATEQPRTSLMTQVRPAPANIRPTMSEDGSTRWPKAGPASYFPSIEERYGRSIADWQEVIRDCGLAKHMEIVGHLKTEYGMGHGHANALVGWTLAGNVA
jgi:hypothetical protein